MSSFSTVGVAGTGVAIVAINNVAKGDDPFPALLAGGLFVFGCVLVSGINPDLGTALAALFLIGALFTRGSAVLNFLGAVAPKKGN
jgi:hypothetical protein